MARDSQYPPSVKPGIPKVQAVPSGWRAVPFGDLLEVVHRPADLDDKAEYQLVTAKRSRGGIVPRERLKGAQIKTETQFFCEADDFLISRRQIIHGACGVVPPSLSGAVVSNEYSTLRVKEGLLLPYLEALSHTTYFQQTCFQSSIGVDVEKMIFKLDDWLRYPVPLPPLPEQKKIAAILSSVDAAIRATQAVIDQTRRVKEGLLQDLLTRGIGHTRFKPTEIGEIPESWQVVLVKDLGEVIAGKARNPGGPGTMRPYLRCANVFDDYIDVGEVFEMPFTQEEYSRYELRSGDILLNEGQSLHLVGRPSLFRDEHPSCAFQNSLVRLRVSEEVATTAFAYQLVRQLYQTGALAAVATQTTSIAHLGVSRFANISVALPPLAEQKGIEKPLTDLDSHRKHLEAETCRLEQVKSGLLQDLLTGRTRVKP